MSAGERVLARTVRTVTTGVHLTGCESDANAIARAVAFNRAAQSALESAGFVVQTTRVVTNSFEEYLNLESEETVVQGVRAIDEVLQREGVQFFSLGPARSVKAIRFIPAIVACSSRVAVSAAVAPDDLESARAAAEACLAIANQGNPLGNFQFVVAFNCPPGIPFFPAGYHGKGPMSFAVGCEAPGTVLCAVQRANGDRSRALANIRQDLGQCMKLLQQHCQALSKAHGVEFGGIDTSLAPSPAAPSVVEIFKSLGVEPFGSSGTLSLCSLMTSALKSLDVQTCGYSGLMLPPLEDQGLAACSKENSFSIPDLLVYSSVCGIGLDCVPIAGNADASKLALLYLDVAALATRLQKPLSARLFPCPGKREGELTEFDSPYLCNGSIFALP